MLVFFDKKALDVTAVELDSLTSLETISYSEAPLSTNTLISPKWKIAVPSRDCGGHNNCHPSSAAVADLTGNGRLEIIVASNNGRVLAYANDHNGLYQLWQIDLAPYFGMAAGSQRIHSSPTIADLNGNGSLEIVIGAGSTAMVNDQTRGGVIVLNANGTVKANWPKLAGDENPPIGYPDTIYATPAVGDLTGDGQLEIVSTGFDKRIYAWRHDGTLLPGFPINSNHWQRFGWANLQGRLADTIWSSPALADVTGDGYLEIIVGTDEGNFDDRWGGNSGGWHCPYATPPGWAPGYCGGSLYAIDRFGNILPNFPIYKWQIFQSTPLLYDVTRNGRAEIFIGTGTFYNTNAGHRFYALDSNGNDLPGWAGGKAVGDNVPGSPAIGDITGDGQPEIVVAAMDRKLYAWRLNGSTVPGFPMTPRDQTGNGYRHDVGSAPILADYTGDGKMEIFLTTGWSITIVNGQGQQLTTSSNPPNGPFYFAEGLLQNSPVVADLNNNGRLELITFNSHVYVWELSPTSGQADWPMFKGNPERTGNQRQPILDVTPGNLTALHQWLDPSNIQRLVRIRNVGNGTLTWNATTLPDRVALVSYYGSVSDEETILATINTNGLSLGYHHLGNIIIEATDNEQPVPNSPFTIPVVVHVVEEIHEVYLPVILR